MPISKKVRAELWVEWTRGALERYEEPDKIGSSEELTTDMVRVSTGYADRMLKAYDKRFDDRRAADLPPDDEDEEEDEDDEDEDEDDED